jgi:hypothetical protein
MSKQSGTSRGTNVEARRFGQVLVLVPASDPVRMRPAVVGWKSRHVTGPSWYGWPVDQGPAEHAPNITGWRLNQRNNNLKEVLTM